MYARLALAVYLLGVHALIFGFIFHPGFTTKVKSALRISDSYGSQLLYQEMVAFHTRLDKNLPRNAMVFIGDSHIQGLAVTAVSPYSVNFGIGSDTTIGVLNRLPLYRSLETSRMIVLAIGFNDLNKRDDLEILENLDKILRFLPESKPVILLSLFPVNELNSRRSGYNGRIRALNFEYKILSENYENVNYLNAHAVLSDQQFGLSSAYDSGDGVHLNKAGYDEIISEIARAASLLSSNFNNGE